MTRRRTQHAAPRGVGLGERANHRARELIGGGVTADVAGEMPALSVHVMDGALNAICRGALAYMPQHEDRREHQGGGIRDIPAGDVRGAAVDGLEDGAPLAEIGAGYETQPAHEARGQVRDDIAVKILEQEDVELLGLHHELQAAIVDDDLA